MVAAASAATKPPEGSAMRRALVIASLAGLLLAGPASAAQLSPTGEPTITVTGTGRASAAAETVRVQFLFDLGGAFDGPPPFEVPSPEFASPVPGVTEDDLGEEQGFDIVSLGPQRITEEDLEPIIEALAAGEVDRKAIHVETGPTRSGWYGPGGALVEFSLDQPDAGRVTDLVTAAVAAAEDAGLLVQHAGVAYDLADCSALLRQARQAALDDGRDRAEEFAGLLGVDLGAVVQLSDYGSFGPFPAVDGGGCPPAESSFVTFDPASGIDTPPFDPEAEAEAVAQATLSMSWSYEATPPAS